MGKSTINNFLLPNNEDQNKRNIWKRRKKHIHRANLNHLLLGMVSPPASLDCSVFGPLEGRPTATTMLKVSFSIYLNPPSSYEYAKIMGRLSPFSWVPGVDLTSQTARHAVETASWVDDLGQVKGKSPFHFQTGTQISSRLAMGFQQYGIITSIFPSANSEQVAVGRDRPPNPGACAVALCAAVCCWWMSFWYFLGVMTVILWVKHGKTMSFAPSPGPQEKHHFLVGGMVTIPKWVVKMAIVWPTLPKTYWGWSLIWWIPIGIPFLPNYSSGFIRLLKWWGTPPSYHPTCVMFQRETNGFGVPQFWETLMFWLLQTWLDLLFHLKSFSFDILMFLLYPQSLPQAKSYLQMCRSVENDWIDKVNMMRYDETLPTLRPLWQVSVGYVSLLKPCQLVFCVGWNLNPHWWCVWLFYWLVVWKCLEYFLFPNA